MAVILHWGIKEGIWICSHGSLLAIYPSFLIVLHFWQCIFTSYHQDVNRLFSTCILLSAFVWKTPLHFFGFQSTFHILLSRLFSSVKFWLILIERNPFTSAYQWLYFTQHINFWPWLFIFPILCFLLLLDNT